MSEHKEYKERFCMSCQRYKMGRFHPIRKPGSTRIHYWQCDDCKNMRDSMKTANKKMQTHPPAVVVSTSTID